MQRRTAKKTSAGSGLNDLIESEWERGRTFVEVVSDFLTNFFGTVLFLSVNILFFTTWIVVNLGVFEIIPVFDPYPFGMLTMIVSLEAIVLTVIVLMSQNRAAHRDTIRAEQDLHIDTQARTRIALVDKKVDQVLLELKELKKASQQTKIVNRGRHLNLHL